jgi:hypothetical protein
MRPTIERAYWSRKFKTLNKGENCDQGDQGRHAWMQTKARPRIASRVRAEWELVVTEEVEVEGKTAMDLYLTLGPWLARLRSVQAATG